MRITFEAVNIRDLVLQMEHVIASFSPKPEVSAPQAPSFGTVPKAIVQEAKPPIVPKDIVHKNNTLVDNAALPMNTETFTEKPKRERTEKQLANDEKMRVAALARIAEKRAAKTAAVEKHVQQPVEEPVEKPVEEPFAEPEAVDPAEMVKIRMKTIEELQAAYANGHQKEVFELLSRFGNGAKSFRELPPESFMPIRKAIDLGALE